MPDIKCPDCGTIVTEGTKFCTECGALLKEAIKEKQINNPAKQPVDKKAETNNGGNISGPSPSPVVFSTAKNTNGNENISPAERTVPVTGSSRVVGIMTYIGLMILFSIPILGFICMIVFACDKNNLSRRNFAIACLIFAIIGVVLTVFLAVSAYNFLQYLINWLNDNMNPFGIQNFQFSISSDKGAVNEFLFNLRNFV